MNIRKILVPIDHSGRSLRALDRAVELARTFGAEVVVMHALEQPIYPPTAFAETVNMASMHAEMQRAAQDRLDQVVRERIPEGIRGRAVLREGQPFHEIVECARDESADLIVIATHGHTGIKHFLLGSTAERVVRMASCPVLTLRIADEE